MRTPFREKADSADLGQLESAGSSMGLSERVEVRRTVLMEACRKF